MTRNWYDPVPVMVGDRVQIEMQLVLVGPGGEQATTIKTQALVGAVGFVRDGENHLIQTFSFSNYGEFDMTSVMVRHNGVPITTEGQVP